MRSQEEENKGNDNKCLMREAEAGLSFMQSS